MSKSRSAKEAIIVESPTKTRTLARFLGDKYRLLATRGHVRDLPTRGLAVDVDHGFEPEYEVIPRQKEHLARLAKDLKGVERVYLACDPDREGEAICWHVSEVLGLEQNQRTRIEFNEITGRAVAHALENPRSIDERRVNAQQARRVLDRIVGYRLSPLLQQRLGGWRSEGRTLSAGRVQSAALRLVVERERERAAFVPREFWRVWAQLRPVGREDEFEAELVRRDGNKLSIATGLEAVELLEDLREARYQITGIEKKERQERPAPPFTTSTLQRAASSRLGLSARQVMQIAQQLYEGVELEEGTTGLITYMRTDSTRIAPEARAAAVEFIEGAYGRDHVGPGVRGRQVRGAQDAHEAIRPTHVDLTPEAVASYLTPQQRSVYRLIWQRFVASQMAPAIWEDTTVDIEAGRYLLQAKGKVLRFAGWRAVYGAEAQAPEENNGDGGAEGPDDQEDQQEGLLPNLEEGERLDLVYRRAAQRFTQPPARFSEGSLVAALERYGIGRPSTYAPIIETLRQRGYVEMMKRQFVATALGVAVYEWLMEYFPQIMDLEFTARMEERLDAVEQGEADWVEVLGEFYDQFARWLSQAEGAEPQVIEGETCPLCGGPVVEKFSRYGRFASCGNYPGCEYTRDLGWELTEHCPRCGQKLELAVSRANGLQVQCSNPECDYVREGDLEPADDVAKAEGEKTCPACGKPMVLRRGRGGRRFWGCSGFPECRETEPADGKRKRPAIRTDIPCPDCGKEMVVRYGRRGPFLGCSGFPKCRQTRNLTDDEKARYLPADEPGPGAARSEDDPDMEASEPD